MTKKKQAIGLTLMLAVTSILVGCSSHPAEETKPMQAGDGSQKPTAVGASGAGTSTAPAANASSSGKATSN